MSVCFICKKPQGNIKVRTVNGKGVKTLIDRAKARNDVDNEQFLQTVSEVIVHIPCYYKYSESQSDNVRRMSISSSSSSISEILESGFDFVHHCFICGEAFQDESDFPETQRRRICQVRNEDTKKSFLDLICKRSDDEARGITDRIADVPSLVDVEARYHNDCSKRLYSKKWCEENKNDQRKNNIDNAMECVLAHLHENREERQFLMTDLMKTIKGDYIPQKRTIKQRLKAKYKDAILFINKAGQDTIVCFKDSIYKEMSKRASHKTKDCYDGRLQKVKDAAAIILEDIRSQNCETNQCPTSDDLLEDDHTLIPETLSVFLSKIICQSKRKSLLAQEKCRPIARSIIEATRLTNTLADPEPHPGPSKKKKK